VGRPTVDVKIVEVKICAPAQRVRQASPYGRATALERAIRRSLNASIVIRPPIGALHKGGGDEAGGSWVSFGRFSAFGGKPGSEPDIAKPMGMTHFENKFGQCRQASSSFVL
jgi:hypothetical protein